MAWINRMWSAPNIVCICVDKIVDGVMEGKLYHRYSEDSMNFIGIDRILKYMDDLYEKIDYPQSAVRERSFVEAGPLERKKTSSLIKSPHSPPITVAHITKKISIKDQHILRINHNN